MPDDLVTIRKLHDASRAEMYRDILEQEGIVAMIPGAQHRSMLGMVGAYVEIPLKVVAADADRAAEIIDAIEYESEEFDGDVDDQEYENYEDDDDDDDEDGEVGVAYSGRGKLKRIAIFIAFVIPGGGHFYLRRWGLGVLFLIAELVVGLAIGLVVFAMGGGAEPLLVLIWVPGMVLSDAFGAASRVREANGGAPAPGVGRWLARGLPVLVVAVMGIVVGVTEQAPAWVIGSSGRTACARLRACSGKSQSGCELNLARKIRRLEFEPDWLQTCARCLKRFSCPAAPEECGFYCSKAGLRFGRRIPQPGE